MKIYCFYLPYGERKYIFEDYFNIETLDLCKDKENHPAYLYAYTDSKEIAEQFKQERNMHKFKMEKIEFEDLDSELFDRFEIRHNSSGLFIDEVQGLNLLLTGFEDSVMRGGITNIVDNEFMNTDPMELIDDMSLFKKKYRDAFDQIMHQGLVDVLFGEILRDDASISIESTWDLIAVYFHIFKDLYWVR